LGYYLLLKEQLGEFTLPTLSRRLVAEGFPRPNESRLKVTMVKSKMIIKGNKPGYYRWHSNLIKKMEVKYHYLKESSEEIETVNTILPESLYANTRGFIERLARQINASYENNIADGCAVLMRRLLEILLILGYRENGKEAEIQDGATHKKLTTIIDYTISTKALLLQKDTLETLHDFRLLGNFSAHAIHYNCRKEELTKIARKYRVAIEDMLYAAKLKI
jgi:hypothetical protein